MAEKYTAEEIKEFSSTFNKLQDKAKKLILNDYYDHIHLADLQYSILQQITNAESYKDINVYLWNSGMLDSTIRDISDKIKQARKEK